MSNLLKHLVLPAVLFAAALAIFFWLVMPLWDGIEPAVAMKKENEANLAQRQQITANLGKLINQYNARSGELTSFEQYLNALEKSLRLFDVSKVSFRGIAPGATQANPNATEFSISVNTYYQ